MASILILEPNAVCALQMSDALCRGGHQCITASTVAEGLDIARHSTRLLTLINARFPWTESFALLRTLEEKEWPLLFLTTDGRNASHLRSLYAGPCGVLTTPFDEGSIRHAVAVLLSETNSQLILGALKLDVEHREASLDGEDLTLTSQEFSLLQALMESPDEPLTREELLRIAWGYKTAGETRTVDVHIQRLRRKLGSSCIETVYKHGYKLKMA